MRSTVAVAVASALAFVVAVVTASVRAAPSSSTTLTRPDFVGPPRALVQFGHVASLVRKGGRYELRFDPALWLGGTTAYHAAVEDGAIRRGEPVPNDYYVREEGHRLLTYTVPPNARVTVLTNSAGIRSTRITVPELAQIVKGKNPKRRALFDRANGLGYWIRVATDSVRSLDQQYQP
jgi:hypothetical protein